MDGAYGRYRVMSLVTGTTLLLLVVTLLLHAVDFHLWKRLHVVVAVVGIGHGVILYPVYLVTCFLLALKARLPLGILGVMLIAGFVPGLAFYMERFVGRTYVDASSAGST